MPKTAFIKGMEFPIPVSQVKIDDVVVVKPGEMIPLDGEVLLGFTAVMRQLSRVSPYKRQNNR